MEWLMLSIQTYMNIHNVVVDTRLILLQYFEESSHIFTGGKELQIGLFDLKKEDWSKKKNRRKVFFMSLIFTAHWPTKYILQFP